MVTRYGIAQARPVRLDRTCNEEKWQALDHERLVIDDREVILNQLGEGRGGGDWGALGRAASTVSREIRRNDRWRGYGAHRAQTRALELRHKPRRSLKLAHEPLRRYVDQKLRQ